MPEPAKDSAGFTEIGSTEFTELRQLLLGPDLVRISELEQHFDNPAKRIAELARDLPDSIRAAKARALRESLEPVFEKAFESSVRTHPKELADAISPVMGPAIRKSIADSIAEFAETLNQIVEK